MKLIDQLNMYLRANPDKKIYKVADEIGIARSVLYEFLRGKRDIKLSVAEKIRNYIEQ